MSSHNVIHFSELYKGIDLSAEHYHPEKQDIIRKLLLSNGKKVSEIVDIIYDTEIPEIINNNDKPVFDLWAANDHVIREDEALYDAIKSRKKIAIKGDIVISRLRSYLKQVAYIPNQLNSIYLSTEFFVFRSDEEIAFLLPFFLSDHVQTILRWSQEGNEHPRFSEDVLLDLKIPNEVLENKSEFNTEVLKSAKMRVESKKLFDDAIKIMYEDLKFNELENTVFGNYSIFTSEYVKNDNRIDPEFYLPKYQNILKKLRKQGKTIGSVSQLKKRKFLPEKELVFNYIEISDIKKDGTIESKEIVGDDAPSRATWYVEKGDIITSTVRPIRQLTAIIDERHAGSVCTSGLAVLEPLSVSSEVLLAYLKQPLIAEIIDLYTTASMYPAISIENLLSIPFLSPSDSAIETITLQINESRKLRLESETILNEAIENINEVLLRVGSSHDKNS